MKLKIFMKVWRLKNHWGGKKNYASNIYATAVQYIKEAI
jgi:hypothetical protein